MIRNLALIVVVLATTILAWAQAPSDVELSLIESRKQDLAAEIATLRGSGVDAADLVDVEIYGKALEWLLRYPEEFFRKTYSHDALNVAAAGIKRARALASGQTPWDAPGGATLRAYRSRVDGSLQPYRLRTPLRYDGSRPLRLDVILHGRNARLNEMSFIAETERDNRAPPEDRLELEVFGRTNNAYRWSGEADVFEAIESVRRRYRVDESRVVLRGFSMGGAGAWHLGLHYPDRWAAVEAGAGFTDTLIYAEKSLPGGLAGAWQRETLHLYDAVDYARNAFNVPIVGYGGEDDPQKQASVNIREALAREGAEFEADGLNFQTRSLRALFLVGPKTGHKFHPDSKATSNAFIDRAVQRGRRSPDQVRFVTYSTRYPQAFWVRVDGLQRPYQRTSVDARREGSLIRATTQNVSRLILSEAGWIERIELDGQALDVGAAHGTTLFLGLVGKQWTVVSNLSTLRGDGLVKRPGLQGPIDDAFTDSFLAVQGDKPGPDAALAEVRRFRSEYPKWLRADVPLKTAGEVTPEDIAQKHLVLFGDPSSNAWIAKIAERLPIRWNEREIQVGERRYPAEDHLLAMIYPNPLNRERYVVLNSGHTFGEQEFRGTNALLFPRLGDWAILRTGKQGNREIVAAGVFDEQWRLR